MDFPRERSGNASRRRLGAITLVLATLVFGYGFLKAGVIAALDAGARVGFSLASGAPGLNADQLERRTAAGAAWLQATERASARSATGASAMFAPQFTDAGHLRVPADYAQWTFVGGATGLAYGEDTLPAARHDESPGIFTHVYMEPGAFDHFLETGTFREGTTFALDMREPTSGVSIATDGWFAGNLRGTHLAVKDSARFDGWAYFNLAADGLARRVRSSSCNDCHLEHGEVDNVFAQFYPALGDR